MTNPMKDEYIRLIADQDKSLSTLREFWMESRDGDKAKWRTRIDAALDERLRLMNIRDSIK